MSAVGVILTGAPGSGKSVTIQALSDLLAELGVEHGAIESEQLGWGHPWLPFPDVVRQLQAVLAAQVRLGRRQFLVAATTETDEQLEALVAAMGMGPSLSWRSALLPMWWRIACSNGSRRSGRAVRGSPRMLGSSLALFRTCVEWMWPSTPSSGRLQMWPA